MHRVATSEPRFVVPQILLSLLLPLLLAACAGLPVGRMALPDGFRQSAAPMVIEGLGGKSGGHYRLGEFDGAFTRSATRLSFLETVVRDSAAAHFDVTQAGVVDKVQADCGMREWRVESRSLSFPVQNLRYACDFKRAGDTQGTLLLAESASSLSQPTPRREGTVENRGVTLAIRAEYRLEGSPIKLFKPSGYRFERDGRTVGAIELTDTTRPTLYLAADASTGERHAAMTGALALSLFWEPEAQ